MQIETPEYENHPLNRPQQTWIGDYLMQRARFAGQEVMAVTDDAGGFQLYYLEHISKGFSTMEEAKAAAPAFARAVLARMLTLIKD